MLPPVENFSRARRLPIDDALRGFLRALDARSGDCILLVLLQSEVGIQDREPIASLKNFAPRFYRRLV
jgi:hypothetical protein